MREKLRRETKQPQHCKRMKVVGESLPPTYHHPLAFHPPTFFILHFQHFSFPTPFSCPSPHCWNSFQRNTFSGACFCCAKGCKEKIRYARP
ncbi:hypothetical protein VNO78_11358 [Psophocarpus tetragonolobus]|uniref:Uncharacterized protein n=1 Tax=Psophocarpus tetragonolobus TaxID=3891 RepID=A0AAN9SM96_PSOTE